LLALAVVGGSQRPLVLAALTFVLWLDYALIMWWVIQVATDLRSISTGFGGDTPGRRAGIGLKVILPSVAAMVALIPWTQVLSVVGAAGKANLFKPVPMVAGVAFVVLLIPAYRTLRTIGVGSSLWAGVLLIPIFHWFAMHRVAADLDRRIDEQLKVRGFEKASRRLGIALAIADVTWVLSILPWAGVVAFALIRGWSMGGVFKAGPVCGTILAAFFAIADLAAMEGVQRQIVTLIRKAS
jgi:hypothetical protein